jgi:hypothetical protein
VTLYDRRPNAAEVAQIGVAALLLVKLAKPSALDPENIVRLSNSLTRALRRAGLDKPPSRESSDPFVDLGSLVLR